MRLTFIAFINKTNTIRKLPKQNDFFGIAEVTNKEIAGAVVSKFQLASNILTRKYDPLMNKRDRPDNDDKSFDVTYGRMRFDGDNLAKRHGQYEPGSTRKMYETVDIKQMFVNDSNEYVISNTTDVSEEKIVAEHSENETLKLSEVQTVANLSDILKLFQNSNVTESLIKYANTPPLTFFFEETIDNFSEKDFNNERIRPDVTTNIDTVDKTEDRSSDEMTQSLRPKVFEELEAKYCRDGISIDDLDPMSNEYFSRLGETKEDFKFDKSLDRKFDAEEHQSFKASDYLSQVREKKVDPINSGLKHRLKKMDRPDPLSPTTKLDSKGYQDYSYQTPNWNLCRRVDVLDFIRGSIIYNNYDILAINKPYGIASHVEDKGPDTFDMNSLVQELATIMRIEKVYLSHRLDKTTTGVLLFATSKERAADLNKLFKADEIKKTYWCITKGIPDIEAAIIDMPIGEFKVAGKLRSCPAPEFLGAEMQLVNRYREARRAVTEYRVLDSSMNMSLLEIKPRSGVKHQIRCHLGFGLNRPILGDHKYSHIGKLAPQKLSPAVLAALHLRQEKVRSLPLHLHALSIVIPRAKANGETLFINAPLAPHFVQNLKALRLRNQEKYK